MNRSNELRPPQKNRIQSPPPATEADDGMRLYLGFSVTMHLAIFALFTLKAVFYPTEPLRLERAIRVDMVGMPDKTKTKTLKPAAPLEEPKPEPKPEPKAAPEAEPKVEKRPEAKPEKVAIPEKAKPVKDKINLNQAKQTQNAALKRLEALRKIEAMKASETKKTNANKPADEQPTLIKGNEVSPGSALTGMAKLENDAYLTSLDEHVKNNWHLPNFLANAKLSASVIVYLDGRGQILKKKLVRSSGNQIFDQTVMDALDRASPFPAPPSRLVNLFQVDGIQLGFPD